MCVYVCVLYELERMRERKGGGRETHTDRTRDKMRVVWGYKIREM